jgi:hypothetical protein
VVAGQHGAFGGGWGRGSRLRRKREEKREKREEGRGKPGDKEWCARKWSPHGQSPGSSAKADKDFSRYIYSATPRKRRGFAAIFSSRIIAPKQKTSSIAFAEENRKRCVPRFEKLAIVKIFLI